MGTASPWGGRIASLDGLRGVAVLGVLLYHLGASWLPGGFLGVSLFFTLSGYLITTLLLTEIEREGTVGLRRFWMHRARRLLPAAVAGVAVAVLVGLAAGEAGPLRSLPGDAAAAVGYVANWRFVATQTAYGAGYEAPSLLEHYWSLGIEEQFYVFFPLLVVAAGTRRRLQVVLAVAVAASVSAGLLLHDPIDTARTYFGTDTRAAELLIGALLASIVRTQGSWPAPRTRAAAAAVAAGGTAALWATATPQDAWLHTGGFAVVACLSALLVAQATAGDGWARALATPLLVRIGVISYGLYVYHWPLFQAITAERTGLHGPALAALRLGATFAVALISYQWLEQPLRHAAAPARPRVAVIVSVLSIGLLLGAAVAVSGRAAEREIAGEAPSVVLAGPTTTQPAPVVPVEAPRLVLVIGDSLLHQGLPTLRDRLARRGIEVVALGGPSENLLFEQARWAEELRAAIDDLDPDIVLLESCCGLGSARRDETYLLEDGSEVLPDTAEAWEQWLLVADELSRIARSRSALTAWVLAPPAQTGGYYGPVEERIERANALYRDLASCRGDLGLVDWGRLAAPDGSYAAELPDATGQLVTVRATDGLHFTLAGQALLADLTTEALLTRWELEGGRVEPVPLPAGSCTDERATRPETAPDPGTLAP